MRVYNTLEILAIFSMCIVSHLRAAEPAGWAQNPIIHADVPDMSMIRVEDTYYMSSTTMHMNPGVPIMKSKDLVNWQLVSYAHEALDDVDELNLTYGKSSYGRGSWASSIRFHNGTYYVSTFAGTTGKTYVYSTKDIEKGPWKAVSFKPMLHDHSLFFDDDGKVYMLSGGGQLALTELLPGASGVKPGGFNQVIIENASSPCGPEVGLPAEGAQLFKVNGKYYLFNIAWPKGGIRTVVVHRADKITGPYEGRVALQDKGVAQGGLIDTPDGRWFAYLFRDRGAVGRIPYLVPVKWENGWPVLGKDGKVPETLDLPASKGLTSGIVASDEFGGGKLPLVWQWNHNPDNALWSLKERPGFLRLRTGRVDADFLSARNTLTQRTIGPQCAGSTGIDVSGMKDGDFAGLALLQRDYGLVGVKIEGSEKFVVMTGVQGGAPVEMQRVPLKQKAVFFKALCDFREMADKARFAYSLDGKSWTPIGGELKMSYSIPHFMGYRFGLFNYATKTPGGHADFDHFRISDRMDGPEKPAPAAPNPAVGKAVPGSNPIVRDVFTADPAPLVVGNVVYLYVGRDNAKGKEMFTMPEWLCYSSEDMKTWTAHGAVLRPDDFSWGEANSAWAAQMVPKNGKFYYFVTVRGKPEAPGNNIGVAVGDSPRGPFKDAIGKPLVRDDMTKGKNPWGDIDPTVWIEDDGTPWMSWGNGNCYLAKLKPNMIELDGEIQEIDVPHYVEGPWLYKRDKLYYLLYAAIIPPNGSEQVAYATAENITGPWTYRGLVTGSAKKSFTIHPGIVDFKGTSYFFYHNAALTINGEEGTLGRRAVCVEYLEFNPDGTIKPITQTDKGVSGRW